MDAIGIGVPSEVSLYQPVVYGILLQEYDVKP
jgi:hypothetical protein